MGITTTPSQNENSATSSRTHQQERATETVLTSIPGPPAESHPDTDEDTYRHWLLFEAWRVGLE